MLYSIYILPNKWSMRADIGSAATIVKSGGGKGDSKAESNKLSLKGWRSLLWVGYSLATVSISSSWILEVSFDSTSRTPRPPLSAFLRFLPSPSQPSANSFRRESNHCDPTHGSPKRSAPRFRTPICAFFADRTNSRCSATYCASCWRAPRILTVRSRSRSATARKWNSLIFSPPQLSLLFNVIMKIYR